MESRYTAHPSAALNRAFAARPYQGADPEKAKYLFVGLDANYREDVDKSPIFDRLLAYLNDGVKFWKEHGVHHPFLLKEYRGDGRYYHQNFARIGFRPEDAEYVSFVEMLHVPTVGGKPLTPTDLDDNHLRRIRDAIEEGNARYIFIPSDVARLMRASSMFRWLPKAPTDEGRPLKVWLRKDSKTIYWHYHFSFWGKEQQKAEQLKAIGQMIEGRD